MEAWRAIPGYEDYYEVSDAGRVRSLSRIVQRSGGDYRVREKILRANSSGPYLCVTLCMEGVHTGFSLHRLVLEAFVGPCPEGFVTRHLNGLGVDNRLLNLKYGTEKENWADRYLHGTDNCGEKHATSKVSEFMVFEIRALLNGQGAAYARAHGLSESAVRSIRKRRNWKHIPEIRGGERA
jgi:hypothetical protein